MICTQLVKDSEHKIDIFIDNRRHYKTINYKGIDIKLSTIGETLKAKMDMITKQKYSMKHIIHLRQVFDGIEKEYNNQKFNKRYNAVNAVETVNEPVEF